MLAYSTIMKVTRKNSFKYKVLKHIQSLRANAIIRADLESLGSSRQISRALNALVREGKLARLGYGIYGKLTVSRYCDEPYLKGGFLPAVRDALNKLGVKWERSKDEASYNEHRTKQIPVNPSTHLITRFRRKLNYKDIKFNGS
jgi:hypothetical protein